MPSASESPAMDSTTVIHRAARAGTALMVRQAFVYGANIVGSIVLARLLPAEQYGYYGIVLFAVAFLGIFGGTGFAANLIRTLHEPSLEEMRVMFTAQQIIVVILFAALWLASPWFASLYHMPGDGPWFFRMIGGALLLVSFMVIPQIRLERELAFDKLAVIEVIQALAFNVSAILLAWRNFGALSFSLALMLRAAIGAVLAYRAMPWKMGLLWHWPTLRDHLHFGIALQSGQFVSMVKDSISPLFIGVLLGASAVGYVTWATSLTAYAVWILMPVQRIYLPLFARLQHDAVQLRRAVSFVLWLANTVAAPLTVITLALSHAITVIVFGPKWLVALPLYYLFCFGNLFVPCSTPMIGVLNALGRSRQTFGIAFMWMTATWVLGVPFVLLWGLRGFAFAMVGVQLSNLVLFWLVRRVVDISPWPAYWPSWPLAGGVGAVLLLMQAAAPVHGMLMLAAYAAFGLLIYTIAIWFSNQAKIVSILRLLRTPA
jgi:O-antigen/teichoic acid export membrane protein